MISYAKPIPWVQFGGGMGLSVTPPNQRDCHSRSKEKVACPKFKVSISMVPEMVQPFLVRGAQGLPLQLPPKERGVLIVVPFQS